MDHAEARALLACQSDQAGPWQESPRPHDLLARQPPLVFRQALDGEALDGQTFRSQIQELGNPSFGELDETILYQGFSETLLQQELFEVEAAIDLLYGRPN